MMPDLWIFIFQIGVFLSYIPIPFCHARRSTR